MKREIDLLNLIYIHLLGLTFFVHTLIRCFKPAWILLLWDVPAFTLLSLLALMIEFCIRPCRKHAPISALLLSFAACSLFLFFSGQETGARAIYCGFIAGFTHMFLTIFFDSMLDRVGETKALSIAIFTNVCILYLAFQGFRSIFIR